MEKIEEGKIMSVTVQQFAEMERKHPNTVYRWIEEGKLDAERDPGGWGWKIFLNRKKKN